MNNRFIEIKKQLGKFIANFSVTEEDGKEYIFDGDEIREGLEISTYDEKGDVIPLPDGEYTIKGVKVKMVDGKVNELPEKESKLEDKPENKPSEQLNEQQPTDNPTDNNKDAENEKETLLAKVEELTARIAELEKENEELKKQPMATPVPQRTDMSSEKPTDVPDNVKGTRFEKAYRIFNH